MSSRRCELACQLLRFAAVGIANTALRLAVILGAMASGLAGPYLANALGYAAGLTLSFALNRRWTFAAREGQVGAQMVRFLLAFAVSYAANLGILIGGLAMAVPASLAQVCAILGYSAVFFLASRTLVFRS